MTYGRWVAGRQFVKRALDDAGQPILKVRCPHKEQGTVHGDKDLLIQYEAQVNLHPCDWTECRHGRDYQQRVMGRAPLS